MIFFIFTDPHYHLASERDHARATFKAHTSTTRVVSTQNFVLCTTYCIGVMNVTYNDTG